MQTTESLGRGWRGQPPYHSIATMSQVSAFADVLKRSPGRVFTTPAVLAELHRHVLSADEVFRGSFWSAVVQMMSRQQVRERGDLTLIEWPDALRARLGRHGPTDIGLIALGIELSTACDEAIIVTNESALRAEPGRLDLRGVTARDPLDLIREVLGPDAADG